MIESRKRFDIGLEQCVDQAAIKVEASLLALLVSGRKHAWPGHRESVGAYADFFHQANVFRKQVVVVTGDLAVFHVDNFSGGGTETVPNAFATSVNVRSAFDLVARSSDTPVEVLRKHVSPVVKESFEAALCEATSKLNSLHLVVAVTRFHERA